MSLLSESGALGSYLGTLSAFLVCAGIASYTHKSMYTGQDTASAADSYVSARNSASTLSLGLSFFASSAGAWVISTVPQAAIIGGPVTLMGYTISCMIPVAIFGCIAPYMRRNLPHGCTFFEYVQARFGSAVNTLVIIISLFYMVLYLSAEFLTIGTIVTTLSKTEYTFGPVFATSIVTVFYTAIGGLPVSLFTDKVQGVGVFLFTIIVAIAAFAYDDNLPLPTASDASQVVKDRWEEVTTWGTTGALGCGNNSCGGDRSAESFKFAFILILAVTCANLMHSGFWQRIWAAEGSVQVQRGAMLANGLLVVFMSFWGVIGMYSYAQYGYSYSPFLQPGLEFLAGTNLIMQMSEGWQAVSIALAVMMVASSADTLQTGAAALLNPIIEAFYAPDVKLEDVRIPVRILTFLVTALVINVPAICIATLQVATDTLTPLQLFVIADIVAAVAVCPVLMGLSDKIHPKAAFAGIVGGAVALLAIYIPGVGRDNYPDMGPPGPLGDFPDANIGGAAWPSNGGKFRALWILVASPGLYSDTSILAFFMVPITSIVVTLLVNWPYAKAGYIFAGYPTAVAITSKDAEAGTTTYA